MLAAVKALNTVLGSASAQHRQAYGLAAVSDALRRLAADTGSRDTDSASVTSLLQAAGVTSFADQRTVDIEPERLREVLEAGKVFMANNRSEKARLKTMARRDRASQQVQKWMKQVADVLLREDAFPEGGRVGVLIRFPAGLADKLRDATDAAACAAIENPQCIDVAVTDVGRAMSMRDQ